MVIHSVIEYAAQVYHYMLTKDQSEKVERLQRIALKIIHGTDTSYREALTLSGLQQLEDWRIPLCLNFTKKAAGFIP